MSLPADFNVNHFLARFRDFVVTEHLFHPRQPLLLAISGGLDSVVLSHILAGLGYETILAHVNFGLRGEESDADQAFVASWAQQLGVPFHTIRVDTDLYRREHRLSIQEAARNLRYGWLEELRAGISAIHPSQRARLLTAHHLDDNIETQLLHFFRGTGLAGMRGMLPGTPLLARPLLFARRVELEAYATLHGLSWREDRSNAEDTYDRNFLRLRVIPLLAERFPAIGDNLAANLRRFREAEALKDKALSPLIHKLFQVDGAHGWKIPVEALRMLSFRETFLWEVLKGLGFQTGQLADLLHLLDSGSGRWVASASHRVVRHRAWLLIHPLNLESTPIFVLDEDEGSINAPGGRFSWTLTDRPAGELSRDPGMVWLDAADLRFPLLLRRWRKGDYFYPLGLGKKKKVARFLIDERMSLPDKERTWVVESDRRIIWVVGLRIDERFKVTPGSRRILRLELQPDA